jgi:F420-dependent oxidoreductase-like protein
MRVGLQIPIFKPSTPETMRLWLKDIAQAADEGGFYSIWMMDHFLQLGHGMGEPETEMLEGYVALGYLAGVTEKIRLGLMVGGVIYRHPAIVVKSISTLDVLSGGRAYFGIGAAWYEYECKSLGLPFPETKVRFELLEEQLKIARQMFAGDTSPYEGKHFQMEKPINNPQPLQKPRVPILIGGMGPRKTLRFVAQYANGTNFFGAAPDKMIKRRLEILKEHCADVGRPYEEIEKTVLVTANLPGVKGSPRGFEPIERGKQLHEMGFDHIIFNFMSDYTLDSMRYMSEEVIPVLEEL